MWRWCSQSSCLIYFWSLALVPVWSLAFFGGFRSALDARRRRLASVSGPLPEELRPVKPPPPVAVKALEAG